MTPKACKDCFYWAPRPESFRGLPSPLDAEAPCRAKRGIMVKATDTCGLFVKAHRETIVEP